MFLSQGEVPTSLPKEKHFFLLLFCPLLRAFQGETPSDPLSFGVTRGQHNSTEKDLQPPYLSHKLKDTLGGVTLQCQSSTISPQFNT